MKYGFSAALLGLGLALGGCATIISGSTQTLTVNSNVDGAEVTLNGQRLGMTPLVIEIERGQTGVLTVAKPGYQSYQVAMNKELNEAFLGNIISGGTFGSSTDYSTGAMYKYEPGTYFASLTPAAQNGPQAAAWERAERLRAFVLLNNEALVADLAASRGDYLDALASMLDVKDDERGAAIARWQAAYAQSETAAEFAGRMVAEL